MPQIGKQGDGVHTRRGVHGVLVLTMMGVRWCVVNWHICTRLQWWQWLGLGSERDGVHTRRGVHGVLVLTMMGVGWCVVNQHSCTLHQWRQWLGLGSERDGVHTPRGVHGVLVLTMMGVGWCVVNQHSCILHQWWQCHRLGSKGMVCTLVGECTASLCSPWWVSVGVWWTSTVAFYISDGTGSDWEARGMVCTLAGECTASLCWPWWGCQLMRGEPAQLHFTLMMACAAQLHLTSVTAVAQTQWGGWCAHSKGSARRPWAAHDGYVRWCVVNQHSCTSHWWWQWPRLCFFVGSGGRWNDQQWHLDAGSVYRSCCARWLCHLTNITCIQQDVLLVWGGNSWTLMPVLFLMLFMVNKNGLLISL